MMTMTMMQRILQSDERTTSAAAAAINCEAELVDGGKPFDGLSYQLAATTASLIADRDDSGHRFLRSLVGQPRLAVESAAADGDFLRFERADSPPPQQQQPPSFFGRDDRPLRRSAERAFRAYEKLANAVVDDDCRRSSCDSQNSTDELATASPEERLTSEEESAGAKDEVRSPVDLTSGRRSPLPGDCHEFASSEESTLDSCRNERLHDGLGPGASPSLSLSASPSPRKLAFSVENILDPNKFTGKQLEEANERMPPSFNWRPHSDFADSCSVDVSGPGKFTHLRYSIL